MVRGAAKSLIVPTLVELCLKALVENVDNISSLKGVPYCIINKLMEKLCDDKRIRANHVELLLQLPPTEVRLKDCWWMSHYQFKHSFHNWHPNILVVLQLDNARDILFDFVFKSCHFTNLAILSLRGATNLTDLGIESILKSSPALLSLNLGVCPRISSKSMKFISCYGGASKLRELFIDDCQQMMAMDILDYVMTLKRLEVFVVSRLNGVSDQFISEVVGAIGENLKELNVADCYELTNSCLRTIASQCGGLLALNLSDLRITDLGFLTNISIRKLDLSRVKLSDDVLASFLSTSGASITELTLKYMWKACPKTAMSLSLSWNLKYLDISWSRGFDNNALNMIADTCSSLRILKVFGFKLDSVFKKRPSNPYLRVVGYGSIPIPDDILEPEYLRYSSLPTSEDPEPSC